MKKRIKPLSDEKKYINSIVYKNENLEIKNNFIRLEQLLKDELSNPNALKIKVWIKNYFEFISKYENELDKNIMVNYLKEMFQKYDKSGKYYTNLDNLIDDTKKEKRRVKIKPKTKKEEPKIIKPSTTLKEEEPLQILNIKKPNISKPILNTFKVVALLSIGINMGIPAAFLTYVIYKLNKKHKLGSKILSYLKDNGYEINNKDELIDKEGKVLTKEKVEKEKVSFLKQKLTNINNLPDDGNIKNNYKKNKYTSMLLNMKIVKSLKSKYKFNSNHTSDENNNVEMHKGMGKC